MGEQNGLQLILASSSRYRKQLLERLGIPFRVCSPEVDEDEFKSRGTKPQKLAEQLAIAKAEAVARTERGATVIGSDQLVAFDGRVLGKPGTIEAAIQQLSDMSGKTHELITACAIIHGDSTELHTDITTLRMRALRRDEIERYVRADQPLDSAGSYKIESLGIALFDAIFSDDQTAIMGLPMIDLTTTLRKLGFRIP